MWFFCCIASLFLFQPILPPFDYLKDLSEAASGIMSILQLFKLYKDARMDKNNLRIIDWLKGRRYWLL